MLSKNKDVEERNSHMKGLVIVIILTVGLVGLPNMMFTMAGYDIETNCNTKSGDCLSADDPMEKMVIDNTPKMMMYYSLAVAGIGGAIGAYKGFQI